VGKTEFWGVDIRDVILGWADHPFIYTIDLCIIIEICLPISERVRKFTSISSSCLNFQP
jgi:hypothetical protein